MSRWAEMLLLVFVFPHFRSSVQAQMKRKHPDSGGDDSNSSSNGDDRAVPKASRHALDDHVTDTVGVVVLDRSVYFSTSYCEPEISA